TPVPAIVVIVPPAETLRTRLSPESLITKLPSASTATPFGARSCAALADPPSPHAAVACAHATPVPATVVITPLFETLRTFWPSSSVIRKPPSGVATARSGPLSFASVAWPPSPQGRDGSWHAAPVPAT